MKKILLSLGIVVFAGLVLTVGGTGAFFSDNETSTGNTFTAGAIDLKIDNESYYNGVFNPATSWDLKDLTTVEKFFNFLDLKPSDYGEDTISLHVNTNDAYLCAEVKLTSNDDVTYTEPEKSDDLTQDLGTGAGLGELAGLTNFIWWADDGDNVLETNETVISQGPIGAIGLNGTVNIPLADSQNNIWTGTGGAAPGDTTLYIGKAWCFGTISSAALAPAAYPGGPSADNDNSGVAGRPEDGGIHCNGSALNNASQTDSLTADVKFTAVQSRNNPGFLCTPPRETAKVTVTKVVINDNGGNNVVANFGLFLDDGFTSLGLTSGVQATVPVGSYNVNEAGVPGYQATFSGDCDSEGNITVTANQVKNCTITNNDLPANITLIKNVINNTNDGDPDFGPTNFGLRVDGVLVPHLASTAVTSNAPHTINETGRTGYSFVGPITGTSSYGKSCPAVLGGSITLDEGETIVCTITNDDN